VTDGPCQSGGPTAQIHRAADWSVAAISAAVLAFEISLMRILLIASWHHFAFVVISVALLGFGASGTVLMLLRGVLLRHSERALFALMLGTGLAMPLCAALAQTVPVEARLLSALLWSQVARWLLFWAVLAMPFLLGGSVIGLAIMSAGPRIGATYASNLIGSGVGAIGASLAMNFIPPRWLPLACGTLGTTAALLLGSPGFRARLAAVSSALVLIVVFFVHWPPTIRVDPYKFSSYVERLQRQGVAHRLAVAYGSRSMVELYRGDVFHDGPFLSGAAPPPPMDALLIDGHWAGSFFRIADAGGARAMDQTLMSFAYDQAVMRPRVLLLGENAGANVWLAARHGAASIDMVQPDANVIGVLRSRPDQEGASVFGLAGVRVVHAEPRHFVEHRAGSYDVIQIASLEGTAAGSSGMAGLGEDHLVTVEGFAACLDRLSPDGIVFVCRGIQTPPRDNPKLLATFIAALRRRGIADPQDHVVIVRDFLGVCTAVKGSPWDDAQVERVRRACQTRELTPVWFRGIRSEELNQPDELPAAPDGVGDWYHFAARRLFSPQSRGFIESWAFDIRPPTDDRPYFRDFCRVRSIGALKQAFGEHWVTRAELAFLFVLGAMGIVAPVAAACILLPLLLIRLRHRPAERPADRRRGGTLATAVYFTSLGLAYLLLEMTLLSRLTNLIGDPVQAAALTIATFLVLSGIGSGLAQRFGHAHAHVSLRIAATVMAGIIVVGVVQLLVIGVVTRSAGSLPLAGRCLVAVILVSPLALLMGFPMPLGLTRLERGRSALVPWAWGVNGFASVLAAPLAAAIGMSWGLSAAAATGLLLYAGAALVFRGIPADDHSSSG
jgi:hypothetical protein